MKKEIRYGKGTDDKARMPTITVQQIEEICQTTGQRKNEAVQAAIAMYYMEVVHAATVRQLQQLQKAYDELYAHHCDVINTAVLPGEDGQG